MADVSSEVLYGKVEGYFTTAGADTVADAGNVPDEATLNGDIVFTPSVNRLKLPNAVPPRDMALKTVTAKVIDGYLVPPDATDTSEKGIHLIATNQTDTSPSEVYWSARFVGEVAVFGTLSGLTVTAGETLNLNTALPSVAPASVVYVTYDAAMLGGGEGGVSDHGLLTGLGDDDHPQYLNNTRAIALFQGQIDGKANASHTHVVADITDPENFPTGGGGTSDHGALTGLADDDHPQYLNNTRAIALFQGQIDGKADTGHGHAIGDVSGLQSALDGKAGSSHDHDDRYYTETEIDTQMSGKAASSHTHTLSDVTDAGTAAGNDTGDFATAAQGALADTAVQPAAIADMVESATITNILPITRTAYDALGTPDANTLYVINESA